MELARTLFVGKRPKGMEFLFVARRPREFYREIEMISAVKRLVVTSVLTAVVASAAWAADATGKWTWKLKFQEREIEQNLVLKQEGEKLTGTLGTGERKAEIADGKVKGDEVSFTVTRERNGQQFKTNYKGKVEGDTIKGTIVTTRDGQERSREWVATRVK